MPAMEEQVLHEVVAAALKAGADAAEAVYAERQSLSVGVRLGALEEVEREEARDLGVRVFVGRRQASVSGSDVSADGRAKLVERVVAMARLAPTKAPVIFENRLAASVMGPLMGAISGPSVARGVSFLKQHLGKEVFSKAITITDEPHRRRGLGSSPYDDEGVANHTTNIID